MDLLNAQFNAGRLSLEEIQSVLGVDFDFAWPTLQKKFKSENGLFFNKRLEQQINIMNAKKKVENKATGDYLEPKDYLNSKIAIQLEQLNKNSGLSIEEFDLCLTQWSLKAIEAGWEYSDNSETDLKRLRAGFEKWLNSWVTNKRNKKNGYDKPAKVEQNLSAYENAIKNFKQQP